MSNPIHDIIRNEVIAPALNSIAQEADAIVTYVRYVEQTVDVTWYNKQGAQFRESNVPLPKDGDGVFKQAVKIGDRVKLGFVHGSHVNPYVSMVYKDNPNVNDYRSKNGAGIMKGINYLLGSD